MNQNQNIPSLAMTPWRVGSDNEGTWGVWTKKDETPGSLNNFAVATGIQDLREAELFAAAPDLLEALKGIESLANINPTAPFAPDIIRIARTAITKATL